MLGARSKLQGVCQRSVCLGLTGLAKYKLVMAGQGGPPHRPIFFTVLRFPSCSISASDTSEPFIIACRLLSLFPVGAYISINASPSERFISTAGEPLIDAQTADD